MVQNALHAPRSPWNNFPDVYILAEETQVRSHPCYEAAKTRADHMAGLDLLHEFLSAEHLEKLQSLIPPGTILAAAHAVEGHSVNIIPHTYAAMLAGSLDLPFEPSIVQTNMVGHTRANGWKRLATPARFSGKIREGLHYYIIDDFVGMGGTLANLKGYIESIGGKVVGASVLTGKPKSARIKLEDETLRQLRDKYDGIFESWWTALFGHNFELLTESEGRFLLRQSKGSDAVRNSIVTAVRRGSTN